MISGKQERINFQEGERMTLDQIIGGLGGKLEADREESKDKKSLIINSTIERHTQKILALSPKERGYVGTEKFIKDVIKSVCGELGGNKKELADEIEKRSGELREIFFFPISDVIREYKKEQKDKEGHENVRKGKEKGFKGDDLRGAFIERSQPPGDE